MPKSDLIVVGGGAAGLMAGCAAGELGLRTLVLERRHKPGRKLLMCGNARCNLTTNISADRMLQMLGDPVGPFLESAIRAFPPSMLQRWFAASGLPTIVKKGNKVYPHTECAADVLNLFSDLLRRHGVTLACSAVVQSLERVGEGFRVVCNNFEVEAPRVLIATGGVSYPKTGSVGDGQQWARRLGHAVAPYRPGLVGFEVAPEVLRGRVGRIYEQVRVGILSGEKRVGETRGVFEIEKWGIGGTAITDASRIVARKNLGRVVLEIGFADGKTERIEPLRTRPIKEAMVTVGGVSLDEVDSRTMESKVCPGLFFAGEVLDIDGPTGGYNLQAAFSTARLAVAAIGRQCGKNGFQSLEKTPEKGQGTRKHPPRRGGRRR